MKKILLFVLIGTLFTITGCKNRSGKGSFKRGKLNEITVHQLSDPDMILPFNSTSADAMYLEQLAFQKLIDYDYDKQEFVGVIAKDRPKITPLTTGEFAGGMKIEYEIRPEATWDNGTPITGYDVAFSIKTVLNPKTNNENLKPYYDWVGDVVVDSTDPKKLTLYSKDQYILVEEYSGYWVLPEYIYDPQKIMRAFTIRDMNTPQKRLALKGNTQMAAFADAFNSEKYQREKGFVVGSGPFEFTAWITGQKIEFEKKKNWWGAKLAEQNDYFKVYPDKIVFKIVNDWSTTQTAIKSEDLDCTKGIEFKIFNEFLKDEKVKSKYKLETPSSPQYAYIGMNLAHPILKDIKVREALAHVVNREQIISTLLYGLATPVESMVHPSKKEYNPNLKPFVYDPALAAKILEESGWKDTDGDGFRDKVIDGKNTKLSLEYKYNAGNETRKNIGLILKEEAKKIGIEMNIVAREWTVFLQDCDKHQFEIYCGSWVGDPNVEDPKQIFHSASANGGSNYVSYGDKISDELIEKIRVELNEEKRKEYYLKFQEKVHNDLPYIFLFAPKERMAFSKRFETKSYTARPGYVLRAWKLVP